MKTPEDVINRFINEENVKFNQERDDWMIEAMEEYAKLYHEIKVKKINIPVVSNSAYFGKVCKWCKSTKTHYDYISIEGVEIWQCDRCKQEFLWDF